MLYNLCFFPRRDKFNDDRNQIDVLRYRYQQSQFKTSSMLLVFPHFLSKHILDNQSLRQLIGSTIDKGNIGHLKYTHLDVLFQQQSQYQHAQQIYRLVLLSCLKHELKKWCKMLIQLNNCFSKYAVEDQLS
ncbi:Hypothetical_protein [Hexamita inflata]|uniref:Hypothetical_protein n=1 Tax=Hexamita inflata TaxID=28002 RepID=A0AA86NPT3_9EUKA|nr:Hypothetical protein HINF_LOCUS11077 [Hexamita inflata]